MVESSTDLINLVAPDGTLLYSSPSITLALGYAADYNIGQEIWHLVHPDDISSAWSILRDLGPGGHERRRVELRLKHADGSWRWFESAGVNRLDDPVLRAVVVVSRDINDRKRDEFVLLAEIRRLATVFDSTSDAIVVVNESNQIMLFNRAAERVFGRSRSEVEGKAFAQLIVARDRDQVDIAGSVEVGAPPVTLEATALRQSGEEFAVELIVSEGDLGQRRLYIAVIRHLAAQFQAESALVAAEEMMRKSFDLAPVAMLILDGSGRIIRANISATEFLRVDARAIRGGSIMSISSARSAETDRAQLERMGDGEIESWKADKYFVRGDGSEIYARQLITSVKGLEAAQDFYICQIEDISVDHEIVEELRREDDRYEAAFESAPTGIAVIDLESEEAHANPAFKNLLGFANDAEIIDVAALKRPGAIEDRGTVAFIGPVSLRDLEFDKLLKGELDSIRVELDLVHAAGHEIPAMVSLALSRDDDGEPSYVVIQVDDISEQKRHEESLAKAATHDDLTGLPNRALFVERLRQAMARAERQHSTLAVLFCDIDHFKHVNDRFGHETGDRLLVDVAEALRGAVRESDFLSRFSGDEFVVLCEDLRSEFEAEEVAERIVEALSQGYEIDTEVVESSVSIGVAASATRERPGELIRRADMAMYAAKQHGRARYVVASSPSVPGFDAAEEVVPGPRPEVDRNVELFDDTSPVA